MPVCHFDYDDDSKRGRKRRRRTLMKMMLWYNTLYQLVMLTQTAYGSETHSESRLVRGLYHIVL